MAIRNKRYEQISFLIPKGGRSLLHVMAIKERCTITDVIRKAILDRAGLKQIPKEWQLKIPDDDVLTPKEAAKMITEIKYRGS